jgi:signal transduction histidine kinase
MDVADAALDDRRRPRPNGSTRPVRPARPVRPVRPVRPGRLGMRARVALAWALGAGLLVIATGGMSYFLVRRYLVLQRDEVTTRQAFTNARVVRDTLRAPGTDIRSLLESLRSDAGSFPLVRHDGRWFGTTAGSGPTIVPPSLLASLDDGMSGTQRFSNGGRPFLAVGVVMPAVGADYVEVFPLESLRHTLSVLRNSVLAGVAGGLLLGAAMGWWTARRVLRPVTRVAEATSALAAGELDVRLAPERDGDLNRLVDSFNAMTGAVRARIEREQRFASDVSHQMRTPLGVLSAASEVLDRRRAELPERCAQAAGVISSQVGRLSGMVLDLLEIARIDAGVADVHVQESELVGLTRLIADGLGLPADVVDDSSAPVRAWVDRRRYEQIVRNLADNAAKYAGGVSRIRVERVADSAVVHVDDAGPGVGEDDRSRIFERFTRGTATQDVPGTGLGLALAADQAALMRCQLVLDRSPEGGARFSLVLPTAPPPEVHEA